MTATAIAPAAIGELQLLPIGELHESPLNPRKHFNDDALTQLADSLVASKGNVTAILVRPRPRGGYEIAAGHRRRRAGLRAGLTHLKAEVRAMEDPEFVEILNIENLQRDDLHDLDEAAGFRTLITECRYDVAKIAARVGLSPRYVYDSLKLLQLVPLAQELFFEGRFERGHAIELSRLTATDQRNAIGDPKTGFDDGGLFEHEDLTGLFAGGQDRPKHPVKAVSVSELKGWIHRHVRFAPEKVDTPTLFPATAAALEEAASAELTVVKITREYRVPDAARDEKERTYGSESWRRADGKPEIGWHGKKVGGKACDFAILGVVVAGPGQGEAFKVCVEKKQCTVHWREYQKDRARAANRSGRGAHADAGIAKHQAAERARVEAEKAESTRWKAAIPAIRSALAAAVADAPTDMGSPLAKLILDRCRPYGAKVTELTFQAKDAAAVLRRAGFNLLARDAIDEWNVQSRGPAALKPFGIDVATIVDQVAPRLKAGKAALDEQTATCAKCGCTWDKACEGGCSWDPTSWKKGKALCSTCAAPAKAKRIAASTASRTRRPTAAFMKPMRPSAALALVIGGTSVSRVEVTKRLWAYIKRKGLQDTKNRRMINADAALKPIFGGKKAVGVFEMTKLINKHLTPADAPGAVKLKPRRLAGDVVRERAAQKAKAK